MSRKRRGVKENNEDVIAALGGPLLPGRVGFGLLPARPEIWPLWPFLSPILGHLGPFHLEFHISSTMGSHIKGGGANKSPAGCYLNPLRKSEGGAFIWGATIWGTLFKNSPFSFLNHFPLVPLQKDYFHLHF